MVRARIIDEILKVAAFFLASLVAVFLICEYGLKPLWHLVLPR